MKIIEKIQVVEGPNYVHLFSGGLDSAYGLLMLANEQVKNNREGEIYPIFMDYGQNAAPTEWAQVLELTKFISEKVKGSNIHEPIKINLSSDLFQWCHNVAFTGIEVGDEHPEIQNRNMVLLSILFSYLLACAQNQGITKADFKISSGFKEGEMGDCSAEFFKSLANVFRLYHSEYVMYMDPLPDLTRGQVHNKIKKLFRGSQTQLELFSSMTTSCYSPVNGKACNKCWKCRRIAMEKES